MHRLTPAASCLLSACVLFTQLACTGEVSVSSLDGPLHTHERYEDGSEVAVKEPSITTPDGKEPPVIDVPMNPCAGAQDPGSAPMRRLTRQEFEHAIGELFEGIALTHDGLPEDERIGSFAINARAKVTVQYVDAFRAIAEELALTLRDEEERWLGCGDASDARACTQGFLATFLPRLFRRAPRQDESARVMALYDLGAEDGSHQEGVRLMMEALLQSPSFLYTYTMPSGTQPGVEALDDMQIAQRMATLLWRGIPDDELLLAVARGELSDTASRRRHAERMIDDPRARVALNDMVLQWFRVDALSTESLGQIANPDTLQRAMRRESERLVDHVMWQEDADYRLLLTAPYTFVDEAMITHYRLDTDMLTEEVQPGVYRVTLPGRRGILTHASVLAHESDVIHRGKRIRNNLLCDDIPGPGDDIDTESIPTFATESERSKAENRMSTQPCSACHLQTDNIGLVFDRFDALGVSRVEDTHGNAVSSLGEIRHTLDINGPIDDVAQLVESLARSRDVQQCVAENLFTYSFARASEPIDACTLSTIEEALVIHDGNLKLALLSVIDTPTFTTTRKQ